MIKNGSTPEKPTLTPTPEPDKSTFATVLSYEAVSPTNDPNEIKGKMDGDTFLPPYYDNDVDKKDLDAIATITSKTDEGIVATNGVNMNNESNKPNSEGWYYPDVNNKKVIAKKYLFDDYDNTKDNGMVKETVELTGENGGKGTQNPSIRWTFRRVKKEEKENSDGSITVTITYNLPVDPDSIPSDWEPIKDPDGAIHKIKKTIKKGEDYNKDVTVKQNGTNATVTTHVEKKWPAPTKIVQAGESITLLVVLAVVVVCGIISRRRMKK